VTIKVTCIAKPPPDTTPPNTTLTTTPKAKIKTKKKRVPVTFGFASSEAGSTFECQLDDAGFDPCTTPLTFKVGKGQHTFEVRALDASRNTDSSPASYDFTVKKKKKRKGGGGGGGPIF